MNAGNFHLSNSMLHDWETICPRVFKAKHIDKVVEFKPTQDMIWGQIFESICIGSTVGGGTVVANEAQKMSVYYPRVKKQAEKVRRWFKARGGKVIGRQMYLYTTVTDSAGQVIPICGGFDILYDINGRRIVIDIKLTGDTENDFGKFAWGAPDKMDLSQSIQYTLIHENYYHEPCDFEYWVFDKGTELKEKPIEVIVSEGAKFHHIERLSKAYNEIMMAITMNDWDYHNTYKNCSTCPCKCEYERVMPEIVTVNL